MIKRFWDRTVRFFGMLFLTAAVMLLLISLSYIYFAHHVYDKTILELDLQSEIPEYRSSDPVSEMILSTNPTMLEIVDGLSKATRDPRILGLVADLSHVKLGIAQTQQLRDAIISFRKSGKSAIAYSDTFGEFAPGNGPYYLASAFDEIHIQPSGDVVLSGLLIESQFYKGTLDKLGVIPRFSQRYEYKNAVNSYTEDRFTDPHRESMKSLMDSIFEQILDGISQARNIDRDELRSIIDRSPLLGEEALISKLVDGLAYADDVYEQIRQKHGEDTHFLFFSNYLKQKETTLKQHPTVALIYGVGDVMRGDSSYNPLQDSYIMGSSTVAGAFRSAIQDDSVKAILFRVDSPGGSYIASDTIYRETLRAKAAGKPVIVVMGNLAASGGYFVSMAADHIVAEPGTLTGSIGVFGGKMVASGLWEKLGVSHDEVHSSAHSRMFSSNYDYSLSEQQQLERAMDRIYLDFTQKAAQGRNMPLEDLQNVARGRVWTGAEAQRIGLVDTLGGYTEAIDQIRKIARIPDSEDISLKIFPEEKSILQHFRKPESSGLKAFLATCQQLSENLAPVNDLIKLLISDSDQMMLKVPITQETVEY